MRRLLVVGIVALVSLPALAVGDEPERGSSGQLEANGRGTVVLDGRLVAFGEIVGRRGRLIIRDRADDATATLNGEELEFDRRGRISVRRAEGRFFVQGSRVQATIVGTTVSVATAGLGRARFRGSGFYRLNSETTRRWNRRGVRIEPTPPSRNRRRNDESIARSRGDSSGGATSSGDGQQRRAPARG